MGSSVWAVIARHKTLDMAVCLSDETGAAVDSAKEQNLALDYIHSVVWKRIVANGNL